MTNLEALKKLEGDELVDLLDEFGKVSDETEEWLNKEYVNPNRMITIDEAANIMRQQWDYYRSGHPDIKSFIVQANIMAQRSLDAWNKLAPVICADYTYKTFADGNYALIKIREYLDHICEPIK